MTIILLEIENNWVVRNLLLDKTLEKKINSDIKGIKKSFIHIYLFYNNKRYSCLVVKNRISYIYLDEALEKSGITFFLNDLYFDHLLYIK